MNSFELCLFSVDPHFVQSAVAAGIDTVVVDWERKGKRERQSGFNTQINHHTEEDLKNVRTATHARIICRINAVGQGCEVEIDAAIRCGADEILIPMVRTVEEVGWVLDHVGKRAGVGILIETHAAVVLAARFAQLPLARVYVGLNDLAIENRDPNIFKPLANGILESVREASLHPFGFGGLTLPECGNPIPCYLLIGELLRMRSSFSFLRRSFHADIQGKDLAQGVEQLRAAIHRARCRSSLEAQREREQLMKCIVGCVEAPCI